MICLQAKADLLGLSASLELSDEIEGVVQELSGFQGQLALESPDQAQLMLEMYRYQQSRDQISGTIVDPEEDKDCPDAGSEVTTASPRSLSLSPCHPANPEQRRFRLNLMGQIPAEQERVRRTSYHIAEFDPYTVHRISEDASEQSLEHNYEQSLEEAFSDYLESLLAREGERGVPAVFLSDQGLQSFAFHRLISASAEQRGSLYRQLGEVLSFEEQLQFVARLGNEMSANYDFNRASSGQLDEISCDDVLSALAAGQPPTGICHDIHLCMAQVLEQMGNEDNVYVIAYSTRDSGHVSMVVTHPEDPSQVHLIDYGEMNVQRDISGPAALSQTGRLMDIGQGYIVWSPYGELQGSLPNEAGMVINQMLGGDNQEDFDPFIDDSRYHLASVGLEYGDFYGNLFAGQLSNGDQIFGVATYVRWDMCLAIDADRRVSLNVSGRAGGSYHHRRINQPTDSEDFQLNLNLHSLTYLVENSIEIPIEILRGGSHLTLTPAVRARIRDGAIFSRELREYIGDQVDTPSARPRQSSTLELTDMSLTPSLSIDFDSYDERLRAQASASQRFIFAMGDLATQSDYVLVPDLFVGDTRVEYDLHRDITVLMGATVALREYGDTAQARIGTAVRGQRHGSETRIHTGFYTPTSSVRNGWAPGGARRSVSAELDYLFGFNRSSGLMERGNISLLFRAEEQGPMWMTMRGGFRF